MRENHIILFGDSIFDNAPYVAEGEAVINHLSKELPRRSKATLRAVDGDVTKDVFAQLANMPIDATHFALSVGGNDALGAVGDLMSPVTSMTDALDRLHAVRASFQTNYCKLLDALQGHLLPLAVCTIYDQVPGMDKGLLGALAYFNDVITRESERRNLYLIDLRVRCDESTDYSEVSPIEPSSVGGLKIAHALANFVVLT